MMTTPWLTAMNIEDRLDGSEREDMMEEFRIEFSNSTGEPWLMHGLAVVGFVAQEGDKFVTLLNDWYHPETDSDVWCAGEFDDLQAAIDCLWDKRYSAYLG